MASSGALSDFALMHRLLSSFVRLENALSSPRNEDDEEEEEEEEGC